MRTTLWLLTLPLIAAPLAARQTPPTTRTIEEIERARTEIERLREATLARDLTGRIAEEQMRVREALLSGAFAEQLATTQRALLETRLQTMERSAAQARLSGQLSMAMQDRLRTTEVLAATEAALAGQSLLGRTGGLASLRPQQGTPEDSLYRLARETLNRGEYGRAAQLFQTLQERFPTARSAPAALYYRAFALYRAGATTDLRNALAALETQRTRYPATADDSDAAALRVRINAALASRGDQQAAAAVRAASAAGSTCDREEMEVRAEALNALTRQDEAAAGAVLGRVLAQRDECSVTLRRRAVYLLGRRSEADVATRLLDVARNDPDRSVRADAIAILGRTPGEQTTRQLEALFSSSTDERTQTAVFTALRNQNTTDSRRVLRTFVGRTDLSEALRASAVNALTGGSSFMVGRVSSANWVDEVAVVSGQMASTLSATPRPAPAPTADIRAPVGVVTTTPEMNRVEVANALAEVARVGEARNELSEEDAAFLRGVYARESSRLVKEAIIGGLARAGGAANDGWLMSLVRNGSEEMRYRSSALSRMRTQRFPIDEIVRLYDTLTDRELRSSVISVLGSRDEDAATDKLADIIRNGTDPSTRREAISALTRKKDPRSTQLLLDLIGR